MFRYVVTALTLAFSIAGCSSISHGVNETARWSVEPSPVEDVDLALIVAQLPAAVACVRENDPAKCGISPDDYLVASLGQRRRADLFSDGPVVINFQSWDDDDNVTVKFVGGKSTSDSGVMLFRRRGTTFALTAVSIQIVD